MKRIISYFMRSILFFIIGFVFVYVQPVHATEREWLILFYVSGNNNRGLIGSVNELINTLEKAGSSDKVTVVVKYASFETGKDGEVRFPRESRTLLIQRDNGSPEVTSPVIDTSPQTNMANQLNLSLFVRKNMVRYPSKKVMLLLWGKGEGFKGVAQDDLSQQKMDIKTLAGALSKVKEQNGRKVDIFATDADLMQMAEVIFELKDYAEIIIGSEGPVSDPGYFYDLILQDVIYDPSINTHELANSMTYYSTNPISSAIRTDKISYFMKLLDQWATAMMNDPTDLKAAATAIDKTFYFDMKDSKDLCDYIDRVNESLSANSPAINVGTKLKNYIQKELIIASQKTIVDPKSRKTINTCPERTHGLAIYLPDLVYNANAYEPLAFASCSQWRNFLMAVMEKKLRK